MNAEIMNIHLSAWQWACIACVALFVRFPRLALLAVFGVAVGEIIGIMNP